MTLPRIKTITSHTGLARFLNTLTSDDPIGYIPRQADIPSPYAYSAVWSVWDLDGKPVIWRETRHKRYEIFEVPRDMVFANEADCPQPGWCAACEYGVPDITTHQCPAKDADDAWRS